MGQRTRANAFDIPKGKFDRFGDFYGLYVASYEGECVCKIGVSCDVEARFSTLQTASWVKVKLAHFYFPFLTSKELRGRGYFAANEENILRQSSYALETACHEKLKELECHLRGEFFELFPEEADRAIRKIAKEEGIRLAVPGDILKSNIDINGLDGLDRLGFFQLANAAGFVMEFMKKCQEG